MFEFLKKNINIIKFVIILLCLLSGIVALKIFQPYSKTIKIYKEALKDYENGDYQNSYYLFSKVGLISNLKPIALYRQALCAKALGDTRAELKIYKAFLRNYPVSKLTPEVKYEAAQLLIENNPNVAKKYFRDVLKTENVDDDYKIASQYYLARIAANNARYSRHKLSEEQKKKVEKYFREYLQKYPDGRHAVNVVYIWEKFNPELSSKDFVLAAKTYYNAKDYDKAKIMLEKSQEKDNWAIKALVAYEQKDFPMVVSLVKTGVEKYALDVNIEDYKNAVDVYLKIPNTSLLELFSIAQGPGKDYIWNLKCSSLASNEQTACYGDLYSNFPKGEYAQDALLKVFSKNISNHNYSQANQIGQEFLLKFPKSENAGYVMFWLGKISHDNRYFQNVINNYPDSFYAYRAFWILNRISGATVRTNLNLKPVIYPYKFPRKGGVLYNLIKVNDYEMISKYTKDDFIKSWAQYQKGDYSSSSYLAQKAMDKLDQKPVKSDIRWRLVYPQNYFKQVQNNNSVGNNSALIMAIIREESHFNMNAQSEVGALGLMQLMPSTAREIGDKYGITFNNMALLNPELNIKLGNLYYASLRNLLKNDDVLSVAAYNGGIGSVNKWKSALAYTDIDEFIEQIPYPETKNYVKKVLKSYWNYVRIYQQE